MEPDSRTVRTLDGAALAILLAALLLAPLPIGSESPWAKSALFAMVAAAAILWALAGALRGSLHVPRTRCLLFVLLFILIGLMQIIPLSAGTVAGISPNANALREQALGIEGTGGPATLSLSPYVSRVTLFRYGAYALLFVVLASLLRGRRAITWTVAVLLAAGLFQVAYGLIDHAAGSAGESVFWVHKKHYASSFSGTFFNKNHFAGFLEMLLPLGIALVVAVRRRRYEQPLELLTDKIADTLSDPATHKRLLLAAIPMLLGIGIVMSVSRSGVVCAVAALGAMAVLAVLAGGRSKAVGALMAVLIAMGVIVFFFASGPLIGGFEQEVAGGMPSTGKRLDMLRSAWYVVSDFPVLGTGLGTTEHVFGRYQSLNLGNIHVDWLANDWAQIACETGLVGLLTVSLGLCCFLAATVRAALRRPGRYCRWVALGSAAGVLAMMLHSFSDFNLTRTMSNGMLFAALLALAHAAARIGRPDESEESSTAHCKLTLGGRPLGLLFALLLAAPLAVLVFQAGKVGAADVRFNYYRHYAGKPAGLYFFLRLPQRLPPDARAAARFDLNEAVRLDPDNPVYVHALGEAGMDEVRRRIEEVADAIVRRDYPLIVSQEEQDPEGYAEFRRTCEANARKELAREIAEEGLLDQAIASFRKAVRIAPTVGWYHLSLAQALHLRSLIVVDVGKPGADDLRTEAERELDRTIYLTYNVPYMLFNVAHAFVTSALETSGPDREAKIARASALLKRAVVAAPGQLSRKSFELLSRGGVDNQGIIEATPETVRANRYLSDFFLARKDWADALTALDRMEAAAEDAVSEETSAEEEPAPQAAPVPQAAGAPKAMPPLFNWTGDDSGSVQFKLDVARRRVAILGYLGQWDERRAVGETLASLTARSVRPIVAESRARRKDGRYEAALRGCREALALAPFDVDALTETAKVTSIPHYRELAPEALAPLACLFRIVVNNESLTPQQSAEVLALLENQKALSSREELIAGFIKSVAVILQSGPGMAAASRTAALHQLEKLAARLEKESILWRQRHLVWHYLGVALEKRGNSEGAERMYAKTVALARTHRPSLIALARLAEKRGDAGAAARHAAQLAELRPAQPCTVTFAGKLRLLGYSIVPADEAKGVPRRVRSYWEFLEPLPAGYAARTYLLDYRWRIVRVDGRAIAPKSGAYPVEFARCGEVVVETRPLPADLPNVRYVAFGMRSQNPPKGYGRWLIHDAGGALARFALIGTAGERGQADSSDAGP